MRTRNSTSLLFGAVVTSRRPPRPEMVAVVRGIFRIVPNGTVALLDEPEAQGALKAEVFRNEEEKSGAVGECTYPGDFAHHKPSADVLLVGTCPLPGTGSNERNVLFGVGEWTKGLRIHAPAGVTEYEVLGMGPVSPEHPARKEKFGKNYGADYQKTRAPWFSDDFDWKYFNAAPSDQQLPSLKGDEELTLKNLGRISEGKTIKTRLPGLRVRVFVRDVAGRSREVPLVLDTLLVDADKEIVTLTWRGLCDVAEDDLSDVRYAIVAKESLEEAPRPLAEYEAELEGFEGDPTGIKAALPAELKDVPDKGVEAKLIQEAIDRTVAKAPPGSDLRAKIAEATTQAKQKKSGGNGQAGAGAVPADLMRKIAARAQEMAAAARESGQTEGLAELEAATAKWQVAPEGKDAPGPNADLTGRDFSGADLRGFDLSGAKLDEANFTGAKLAGANLAGASLAKAILVDADLTGADLSGANLSMCDASNAILEGARAVGCNLSKSSLSKANLKGADFSECRGEMVSFCEADLRGTKLAKAKLAVADFQAATLEGSDWSASDLERCFFFQTKANAARFTDAKLDKTTFAESELDGASFVGAKGKGTVWLSALLDNADFGWAILHGAAFDEAKLRGAKLFGADLRGARMYRAQLDRASFERANLFEVDARKATLRGTDFSKANLYGLTMEER